MLVVLSKSVYSSSVSFKGRCNEKLFTFVLSVSKRLYVDIRDIGEIWSRRRGTSRRSRVREKGAVTRVVYTLENRKQNHAIRCQIRVFVWGNERTYAP